MKVELEIPAYSPERGLELRWEPGAVIETRPEGKGTLIMANSAGLLSLAYHLLTLAQPEVPAGAHIHYDDSGSLEEGSLEMIVEKG